MNILNSIYQLIFRTPPPPANAIQDAGSYSSSGFAESMGLNASSASSLNLSTVHRCITLISNIIAAIPVRVVRWNSSTGYETIETHPVSHILSYCSNPSSPRDPLTLPSFVWKQTSMAQLLGTGNSCLPLFRDSAYKPIGLKLACDPASCKPYKQQIDPLRYYQYTDDYARLQYLTTEDVLHFRIHASDGFIGRSPIVIGAASMDTTKNSEVRADTLVRNGRPEGFLQFPQMIQPTQKKEIRDEWRKLHMNPQEYNVGILSGGADWKQYGFSADAIQLLQTRQFQVHEMCRWFGVPPQMLYETEKASKGTAVQLMAEFLQSTIIPYLEMWRTTIRHQLFTMMEYRREGYDIVFDIDELSRADQAMYTTTIIKHIQNALLTVNDVRDNFRRPRVEHGDDPLMMASQMAPLGSDPYNPTDPTQKDGDPDAEQEP
jgi:HK97 family phage portal protein